MISERFPRHREKWSPYEDAQLLKLYAEAEAHPGRKYFWADKWRTAPVYYIAAKLGRTPGAVGGRRATLLACQKRRECEPAPPVRRFEIGK